VKLNEYLNFAGNAEEAFDFYRSVFGGAFSSVVRFKEMPMPRVTIPKEDENKLIHIALPIGKQDVLMASDTLKSLGQERWRFKPSGRGPAADGPRIRDESAPGIAECRRCRIAAPELLGVVES
jgi:hypothetical protein